MDQNRGFRSGVVLHLADFYLASVESLQNRFDYLFRCLAVGQFRDVEGALVEFFDFGPHFHRSTATAVVVFAHVDEAPGHEVGEEFERLVAHACYCRIQNLVEVMRQDRAAQTDSDTFGTLGKEQREFGRERHGLALASVVAQGPFSHFGIEKHFRCERRQARFDISCGGRIGAGQDISPVTLCLDEQFFLTELYECVLDRCIAMGMVMHGCADDVCHFVEPFVVDRFHRMEDAPLHGLQAVVDMRDGTLQNHI